MSETLPPDGSAAASLVDYQKGAVVSRTVVKKATGTARRKQAGETYVHAEDAGVSRTVGYRPGRKGHTRRGRTRG